MTFSMILPSILRRMIGLNIFGKSYNALFGFGIMIEVDILKCDG